MTDPFLTVLEELKANVAELRERADALLANRTKVPPALSTPEQAEKAERLRLALMATADEIWTMGMEARKLARETADMVERTTILWTDPLNDFSAELDGKIKSYKGDA